MGKVLPYLASFLMAMIFMMGPVPAQADTSSDVIHITCSKELNYFSLHVFRLIDRNDFPSSDDVKRQEQQGFFSVRSLLKHPYTCGVDAVISIEVTHYQPAHYPGACGLVQRFSLLVKQNNNPVYEFNPYEGDWCANPDTHFIEMLEPANKYSLKDCVIPNGEGEMSCTYPVEK